MQLVKFQPSKKTTTFVAIELPKEIREKLVVVQNNLVKLNQPVVWELPEKLHVTVAYLGNITSDERRVMTKVLIELVGTMVPFEARVGYLSYFFQKHGSGSVWIGVNSEGVLERFRKEFVKDLNRRGFSLSDKKLVAHVTLGRLKKMRGSDQKKVLDKLVENDVDGAGSFEVDEVAVMSSRFRKGINTTEYTVRDRVRLNYRIT